MDTITVKTQDFASLPLFFLQKMISPPILAVISTVVSPFMAYFCWVLPSFTQSKSSVIPIDIHETP